jgi:hypothetical protein
MLVLIQFHLLSFEGPDAYARAGGIATRVSGLAQALAEADFDTHLWFIGDPALPGHETQESLHLHRWFQWISRYHPASVYDGEEGKRLDYAGSLPPFLLREMLWSRLQQGGGAVILAEEWHTVQGCATRSRCSGMPITPLVSIASTGGAWQRPRRLRP